MKKRPFVPRSEVPKANLLPGAGYGDRLKRQEKLRRGLLLALTLLLVLLLMLALT